MNNQISVGELIQQVGQLSTPDFEAFFRQLQSLRSQKVTSDASMVEMKLLRQIKTGLLSPKQTRFEFLIARRDAGVISETEMTELIQLTEDIEKSDLSRLKRIAKLADLKHMSLPEVVHFYKLQPIQHG